ncbi:MAG: hypothetical protein A2V69_02065 [Candidatus Portnoybacteria bacterium RBG_13_40_8]|uniref:Uncharacterized protein n=1 Tax=Candidatus Portnoybacteria bacterium RBG_13_40_8 TaxID=1801990 RepID=A0A1G2F1V1_9BACT|nr:MAG: hypothetical protein A2V69_02065 [Candidatus Portnoybacteria bacterium RBG_13_40_8]OGZ35365.1 MAG: hypothetical protein A2V60_03585 [Candidatus Portnoybacteria bacterium RIFCSPHIGHO2_01_FULL_39_19]
MTEKAIKLETKISTTLFWICFFITFLTIFMSLAEFFSRGGFPPSRINIFYIGVLSIYALHKEALRFLDRSSSERGQKKGEMFVYIWVIMTAILYLINFTTKDYYSYSGDGKELLALTHISFIALEVGMVFVLARILKLLMIKYLEKNEN